MNTEGSGNETLSAAGHGKTTATSAEGKRLVSETEWQLLHREVRCCLSGVQNELLDRTERGLAYYASCCLWENQQQEPSMLTDM